MTVSSATTSTTLRSSRAQVVYGQAVTFTATVTGGSNPTGDVTFYSGAVNPADELGQGTLSFSSGADLATLTINLSATSSPYAITAVYGGDSVNLSSTSNILEQTVNPAPLSIIAANETKVYGQANPALSVSYSGFTNGDDASSLAKKPTVTTNATTTSPAGTYAITAAGAVDSNYAITYMPGTLTVSKDSTTTSSASRLEAAFGQSTTFSVTVTANAPGSGTPSGQVSFFDSNTGIQLASVSLMNGAAALSTTALTPGTHSIAFTYAGDSNFLAGGDATRTITIDPSIIVLDPIARGALGISGNASIAVTGVVDVDSGSSGALIATGTARISAARIEVHGGVSRSTSATLTPQPISARPEYQTRSQLCPSRAPPE